MPCGTRKAGSLGRSDADGAHEGFRLSALDDVSPAGAVVVAVLQAEFDSGVQRPAAHGVAETHRAAEAAGADAGAVVRVRARVVEVAGIEGSAGRDVGPWLHDNGGHCGCRA